MPHSRRQKSLKPNLLNVYANAPQAINLVEQGEAWMIGGQFSAYTLIRKRMLAGRSRRAGGRRLCDALWASPR